MLGEGGEPFPAMPGVDSDPLPLMHHLDGGGGDAQLQDLPHQGMGNAVEALVHLDVVVDAGLRLAPLGVRVVVLGQRLERRPVQGLEQVLAALGASLEGPLVERGQQLGDGGIQLGQGEERAMPQPGQDPAPRSTTCTATSALALSLGL